jgi:hypothetical protein
MKVQLFVVLAIPDKEVVAYHTATIAAAQA